MTESPEQTLGRIGSELSRKMGQGMENLGATHNESTSLNPAEYSNLYLNS